MDPTLQRKQNKRASMDSISVPDTDKIKELSEPKLKSRTINNKADEIFDGHRFNKVGRFDKATKFYGTEAEKRLEREGPVDEDDFIPKPDPNKKAPDHMHKGVKVAGSYIERRKVWIWIAVALIALLCAMLFLPPVMSSKAEDTTVLYERNVFNEMGMTEFKSYALANYSVYSEKAFSSEKAENYRVIELTAHLQNSSPFEIRIPQYTISKASKKYKDAICYVTSTNVDKDGKVIGDTVPGFGGKDVKLEIMVNVTNMTDAELDDCITGLVISTQDMGKKITSSKDIPCLPAWLFVSNNVSVSLEP